MINNDRLDEIEEQIEELRGDMSVTSIECDIDADDILDDMEWLIGNLREVIEICKEVHESYRDLSKVFSEALEENVVHLRAIQESTEYLVSGDVTNAFLKLTQAQREL